ncbi:bulb-type lectin domain-containing protein [Artemisia annua]|uniref:Bulb-type lectin domain-containing protein n=1 Tax=Artemisia annua TaxID=35608 RepID=A0A2U1LK69_ARTAN|nr:bulb-type lectin domain-containing protein [Artemisia annua]
MANTIVYIVLIVALSCYYLSNPCCSETDTLQQGLELKDWDELISSNRVFVLKFFSFYTMVSPYLGIFYKDNDRNNVRDSSLYDLPNKPVWVANRNNPIPDIYGKLVINVHAKLSILSSGGTIYDLFSPSPLRRNASAKLLDNGNLVLQELYSDGSVKQVLWQSFDYPTDTLLPGMKLGINIKTGHRWSLTSWENNQLPASGSFTLTGDLNGTGQLVILKGGNIHWSSGPWRNGGFGSTDTQSFSMDVRVYYTNNETEQSFTYLTKTYDSFPALMMSEAGRLDGSTIESDVFCALRYSLGRSESMFDKLKCRDGYHFNWRKDYHLRKVYHSGFKYTHRSEYDESHNLTLFDCKRICWADCSCTAYSYATKNRTGCRTYGKRIFNPSEVDRDTQYYVFVYREKKKKWFWLIIGVGSLVPLILCYVLYKKLHGTLAMQQIPKFTSMDVGILTKIHLRQEIESQADLHRLCFTNKLGKAKKLKKLFLHKLRRIYNNEEMHGDNNNELHYFTFKSIVSATNNFSSTNKLGEGGFGAVYKAWELWNKGRGLEFMDSILENSCSQTQVTTCIHVGLLCVQDHATDRPTMSEVINMLTNENMHLPEPKRPAFFIERHEAEAARDDNLGNGSVNGQSISILVAR